MSATEWRQIVVAVRSPEQKRQVAILKAAELARRCGARLTLLHSFSMPYPLPSRLPANIDDILGEITRTPRARPRLARSLQGLVDARNGTAHGDQTVQPSGPDLTQYLDAVEAFATRADRKLSKRLSEICGGPKPW